MRRRCRASSRSISENCVSSGVVSTKLRRRGTSAAGCWCELSHTACRNSPVAGCPEPQRQLLRIAQHFTEIGEATIRDRPELKPGTRLMREWQGRTYDVLVLDDGFSWQSTRYHSALHSAAGWPRLLEPAAGRGDLAGLPTRRAHHDAADRTRSAAGLDRAAQTARQLKPQTRRSAPGHDPTAACALLQML